MANIFCMGTRMTVEILARVEGSGIPEDHPKNPGKMMSNISEGFFRTLQNCMEFNALTNMGLCLFQDFFVIKTVYMLDRGYLNAPAIYSLGMVGSLCSMIYFRRSIKDKLTENFAFLASFEKLKYSGLVAINLAAFQIIVSSFLIFWNTFPDSVAVYNPFRSEIGLRGVTYTHAFFIFSMSYIIVIVLIMTSMRYTGPRSSSVKSITEFSSVCFSLCVLKADYWAYYASVMPIMAFFVVILISYTYANVFGISITYLGVITFY